MNTNESNVLIAQFMGAKELPPNGQLEFSTFQVFPPKKGSNLCHTAAVCMPEDLQYHTSWDWLMPVVEKIHLIDKEYSAYVSISKHRTSIMRKDRLFNPDFKGEIYAEDGGILQNTYQAVIQFIQWYNKQ